MDIDTGKLQPLYTREEIRRVMSATRKAAASIAEYWDVLRELEDSHDCEFDGTMEALDIFASALDSPPTNSDLAIQERDVIAALEEMRIFGRLVTW